MKKIKSINELPDWFDLQNYKESLHINAQEWHANLTTRKESSEYFSSMGIPTKYYGYSQLLETDPIIRAVDSPVENREYDDSNENLVFTLDKHQAYSFFLELPEEEQVRVKKMLNELMDDDTFEDMLGEITDELYAPLIEEIMIYDDKLEKIPQKYAYHEKNYNTLYAGINLDASDDLIFEHFKLWLKNARENQQITSSKRQFTKNDFLSWYEASVLPYLDLKIWAEHNNVKIPYHIMGQAIHPAEKDINISEAVRKTTKPLAEKLMRYGWAILGKQAYLEQYPIKPE